LDSSVVAAFARQVKDRLNTFVVGISGSGDMAASLDVAKHLGTEHHLYQYTYEEMLQALPEVIYHLESFDAALVRSAIPNYFLAKLASDHVKVILTGEGADELYAGYEYFTNFSEPEMLQHEMVEITGNLHNTNLQRADRMSMAHGLEARVPFLDIQFVDYSLSLPPYWKLHQQQGKEKALLRQACRELVPERILERPKKKFSDGAGSMNILTEHADQYISDEEFAVDRIIGEDQVELRSKEEMYYYQIFRSIYGDSLNAATVGRTRSVTEKELQ
jgi:asparagine synthase (glutamine-hydrolysing)